MILALHSPLTDMEHKILLNICLTILKEAEAVNRTRMENTMTKRNKRTIRKTMFYKTKDGVTRIPLKTEDEGRYSG